MALERVNGFLGRVGAVVVGGGGKLICNIIFGEEGFKCRGAFIIVFLEEGSEAAAFEVGEDSGVSLDEVVGRPIF